MKLEELLRDNDVPLAPSGHHHSRPGWLQMDCPFCSPGTESWRLGFNTYGRYMNCWACGPHGLVETVALLLGKSAKQVSGLLEDVRKESGPATVKPTGRFQKPRGCEPLKKRHKTYLRERGFDVDDLVRLWGLEGIGALGGPLKWRIYIPIYSGGEPVSWTTRAVTDSAKPRYWSAKPEQEKIAHKQILYGGDYVRGSTIVFEGPTDVWKIGPGTVCTCGTGFSRAQLKLISQIPKRAICFDNEPAAQQRAADLAETLSLLPGETFNVQLDAKDAAEASAKEVKTLRRLFL